MIEKLETQFERCSDGVAREYPPHPLSPIDLEKEVEMWYGEYAGNRRFDWNGFARHFYEAGAEWQKSQMLKDAVEGEVENGSLGVVYLRKNLTNDGYSTGDKVRIVVLKAEEE